MNPCEDSSPTPSSLADICRETSILRIDKVKGCMFVNQYLVVKFLGRGACGKVFLCLNTHDLRLYAMKVRRLCVLATMHCVASGKSQGAYVDGVGDDNVVRTHACMV